MGMVFVGPFGIKKISELFGNIKVMKQIERNHFAVVLSMPLALQRSNSILQAPIEIHGTIQDHDFISDEYIDV